MDTTPDPIALEHGPAWAAAQRSGRQDTPTDCLVGYRRTRRSADPSGDSVAWQATRALLTAGSRAEVAMVLHAAINDLGGAVVPARLAGAGALPVDVSLGVGEPTVVMTEPLDPASLRISAHLPMLVEDAKAAAARCDAHQRATERAAVDALTGVGSRHQIGPRLGVTGTGAVVCMLDVDGLKELNDTRGHAAGDRALSDFGRMLAASVRGDDFVGRYGGDEFIVILTAAPPAVAKERMQSVAAAWRADTNGSLTVSGGLAAVDERGAVLAARAADMALYRAKRSGRNRIEEADDHDYRPDQDAVTPPGTGRR